MRAICVDDEPLLLGSLLRAVEESADIELAVGFGNDTDALSWARDNRFDMAFLDIELQGADGITLAEKLRELNPECGIIYCTGYKSYALKAIERHVVDGYLVKPIDEDEVKAEIELYKKKHRRDFLLTVKQNGTEMTFFDRSGNLLAFKRGRTNELFTALVRAGGSNLSTVSLCCQLWKDNDGFFDKNKRYLWQLVLDLKTALKAADAEEVLIKTANGYAVKLEALRFA